MSRIHCITYQRLGFILEMQKRGYQVVWSDAVFAMTALPTKEQD